MSSVLRISNITAMWETQADSMSSSFLSGFPFFSPSGGLDNGICSGVGATVGRWGRRYLFPRSSALLSFLIPIVRHAFSLLPESRLLQVARSLPFCFMSYLTHFCYAQHMKTSDVSTKDKQWSDTFPLLSKLPKYFLFSLSTALIVDPPPLVSRLCSCLSISRTNSSSRYPSTRNTSRKSEVFEPCSPVASMAADFRGRQYVGRHMLSDHSGTDFGWAFYLVYFAMKRSLFSGSLTSITSRIADHEIPLLTCKPKAICIASHCSKWHASHSLNCSRLWFPLPCRLVLWTENFHTTSVHHETLAHRTTQKRSGHSTFNLGGLHLLYWHSWEEQKHLPRNPKSRQKKANHSKKRSRNQKMNHQGSISAITHPIL